VTLLSLAVPAASRPEVRRELSDYGGGLERLPELVVLSKRDLGPEAEAEARVAEWRERLGDEGLGVLAVSSATGAGIEELTRAIFSAVPSPDAAQPPEAAEPEFEADHMVYRPAGDQGFDVERLEEGVFRVKGRGIELLVGRHDLENPEAAAYVEQRLAEIGVIAALRAAGFDPGDELRIGDEKLELHPG
jgi:GTP-binding protein